MAWKNRLTEKPGTQRIVCPVWGNVEPDRLEKNNIEESSQTLFHVLLDMKAKEKYPAET